ncbi:MAG: serine/threonine-protein phosphatase [Calditrichaeota bacterium]|nr:MAG: serine/threonine-protein phosphatase [Calditrichota bacterium]
MQKNGFFKDFFGTIRQDLQETGIGTSLNREFISIYEFYLTPEERQNLAAMPWAKRLIYRVFILLKNILLKLSPFRRLLLLIALFFLVKQQNDVSHFFIAFIILFIILLLELKDKLLAHDELKAGRAVQAALRPQKCRQVNGWQVYMYTQSANEVGGDLIDCLACEDESSGYFVGDVAGKGLGAALLMAQLQASVHALLSHVKSPAKLVSDLNRLYCRGGLADTFISFIYLKIEPRSGIVKYVNAGHLPPIWVHKGEVFELEKGGLALGLAKESAYNEQSQKLEVGDFLVIYTDGLIEARDRQGYFFGETRLSKRLQLFGSETAESAGKGLVSAVEGFVGNSPRADDLTLLLLKRVEAEK